MKKQRTINGLFRRGGAKPSAFLLFLLAGFFTAAAWYGPAGADAAVTYDSANPFTSNYTTSTRASVSFAHVVGTCSDRLLVVIVNTRGTETATSVAYGGSGLTSRVTADEGSTAGQRVEIFTLVNPPSGSATVSVTYAAATSNADGVFALNYCGVNQATPTGGTANAFGTGASNTANVSITTQNTDALIVGGAAGHGQDMSPWTVVAGMNASIYEIDTGTSTFSDDSYVGGSRSTAAPGNYSFGWTSAVNDNWAVAAVELVPAPSDVTPPVAGSVNVSPLAGVFTLSAPSITTVFTDNETDVTGCEYTTSGSVWLAGTLSGSAPDWTCTASPTGLTGSLSVNMRATSTGGTGTGTAVPLTVDTSGPVDGTLTAAGASSNQIDLSWSAATDGGSGLAAGSTYKLVTAPGAVPPADCGGSAIYTGTATTYSHGGLTPTTQYSYRVCAFDALGNVSPGAADSATTLAEVVPDPPTGISLSNMTSAGPTITWSPSLGAATYNVYRSVDGVTWGPVIGGVGAPSTSYADSGASKTNTTYYWTVTAQNGAGESVKPAGVAGRTALCRGYNSVSAPYDTMGQSPVTAFGSWADWGWEWISSSNIDPDNSGTWFTPLEVTPGKGIFLWAYNNSTVLSASGPANPASLTVALKPGWTLISNHSTTEMTDIGTNWIVDGTVPLSTAVSNNIIGGALSWWNGSAYESLLISLNPAISPWKAFFILNMDSVDHTLAIQ